SLAVPHHFNQSVGLELPPDVDTAALERAVAIVYRHHDVFRLRFTQTDQGWHQRYTEDAVPAIQWFNLEQQDRQQQDSAMADIALGLQQSLSLQAGPLVAFGGFNLGESRPDQLLIVSHHLVIDGVSWRILLADLHQAYAQAVHSPTQDSVYLAPKTHSYQQWASYLEELAQGEEIWKDLDYWAAIAATVPQDSDTGTIATAQRLTEQLDKEQTRALQQVPSAYGAHINDVLLTALTLTLIDWTGQTTALIDLESYGRFSETLDLSRTVGWFTCLYPIGLSLDAKAPLTDQVQSIKQQLQTVPHNGLSYGLLRYLNNQQKLAIAPAISFNYLGRLDLEQSGEFRRLPFPAANQAPNNQRLHQIDINSWVEAGQFSIEWTFNSGSHSIETIRPLAQQFIAHLDAIIAHGLSKKDHTPDEFNLVQLDQSTLDAVLAQVSFAGEQEVSP
ncbi:MAG: non-ribosomal peptide synthetase, partial [Symploca sp. SIO2G7]|nr:non-ribosomal peptide synthetase [Symploca sp. SIO2G7]